MFYILNNNIYLVQGSAKSCIYDFNASKLYSINKTLAEKIDSLNNGKCCIDSIDIELKKVFEKFLELDILSLSEMPVRRKIDELKTSDLGINMAWIEISNKCNLRCRHCYNESDVHCEKYMSLDNYKIVIDNLLKLGIKKVQIIGGEPFINENNLKYMLNYTIDKFEVIEIFTNGTLITSEWFEYLSKNNIHIALSVYSYNDEMHDKVTGSRGSWEKTNKTIQKLKKYGVIYRVCNVLMKGIEIGEKNTDLYELSNERDIVRMSGRANYYLLSDELIKKKLITKKTFQEPIKEMFCRRLLSGHNCFKSKIYISANMEVFPCVMERRLKHCEISKDTGIRINESICNLNKDKIKECCLCEYRYACFDCRPNSLSGEILEKPWYCTYNPLEGKWEDEETFIEKFKEHWGNYEVKNERTE